MTDTAALPAPKRGPMQKMLDGNESFGNKVPHPAIIFDAIISLVEGRATRTVTKESVCARCKRQMEKSDVERIMKNSEGMPDPERCFLSQGYLCMGSVTLDRCLSPCPLNGVACTGCAGATMQILTG